MWPKVENFSLFGSKQVGVDGLANRFRGIQRALFVSNEQTTWHKGENACLADFSNCGPIFKYLLTVEFLILGCQVNLSEGIRFVNLNWTDLTVRFDSERNSKLRNHNSKRGLAE